MTVPILDLTQLVNDTDESEPPVVTPDGEAHYFRSRDALTLRETAQLQRWITARDKLAEKTHPTEQDEETYEKLQADICAFGLPTVDREVIDGLNSGQRKALVILFLIDSGLSSTMGKAMPSRAEKIGAMGSPASNGSTG